MQTESEFAQKIKAKHPAYAKIPDAVLVQKIVEKYPVYKDQVQTSFIGKAIGATEPTDERAGEVSKAAQNINAGQSQAQIAEDMAQGGGDTEWSDLPGNILPSIGQLGKDIYGAVSNPIDTGKALGKVAIGGGTAWLPGKQPFEEDFNQVVDFFKNRYGSLENLKETIINDPAGFALDLSGLAGTVKGVTTGTKISKLAGDVKKVNPVSALVDASKSDSAKFIKDSGINTAKSVGGFGAEQVTGLPVDTMKIIKDLPDQYKLAESGDITRFSIADEVKSAISSKKDTISELGQAYADVRKTVETVDLPKTDISGLLKGRGLKYENGGIIEVGKLSSNLSETDLAQLNKAMKLIDEVDTANADQVLNLRNKLDDLVSFDKGVTSKGEALVKDIRKMIDERAKEGIPGLKELDEQFAPEKQFLDQVQREYIDPRTGELKDSALNQIANATGKGKDLKLERLEELAPGITDKIKALQAYETVTGAGLKPGTYTRAALPVGLAVTGNIPQAILAAFFTQPKIVTKAIMAYGKAQGISDDTLKAITAKIKALDNLTPEQKKILQDFTSSEAIGDLSNVLSLPGRAEVEESEQQEK